MNWIILIFLFIHSNNKPVEYAETVIIGDCVKEGKITLELEDRILIVPIQFDCKDNRRI